MSSRNRTFQIGCWPIGIAISALAVLVLFVVFRGLGPFHWVLFSLYSNPVAWVLFVATIVAAVAAIWRIDSYDKSATGFTLLTLLLAGVWVIWIVFLSEPTYLVGLYQRTEYERTENLVPVAEPRPVSYAEAKTNFLNQNPEAKAGPGDLDYVRGRWIAEFGPSTAWNKLFAPTQGFFFYDPDSLDKVQIVRQIMPFAESGWLWNSAGFFVHQRDPFVEFHEVLYLEDPDYGGHMAMISLIKRDGWRRTPYVWKVLLIHADGETEWLSPNLAEKDPRLEGIQLTPEWLEKRLVEAYGWRNGLFTGLLARRGRVEVQRSTVNAENSPPYHLDTVQGPMWYTPYGPLGKESMKGIMLQDSHDIDGTIFIWELPGDQAYQGLDALATQVKAVPHQQENLNWLRVSSSGEGTVRAGVHDVIELIPVPRSEDDGVELYFMGFVAVDPPTETMFYTIVNPRTRDVLTDAYELETVRQWLRNELVLPPQTVGAQQPSPAEETPTTLDLDSLSSDELMDLIRLIIDELEERGR